MPDFPIIFFDCETNAHKAIVDLGAISTDGATFHSSRIADLQRFVWDHGGESALIAGHNICHFSRPKSKALFSERLFSSLRHKAPSFTSERTATVSGNHNFKKAKPTVA